MNSFETFLKELAKALKLPSLIPDEKGACLVILKENHFSLLFEYDEQLVANTILVSSAITFIPKNYRTIVYETLLKENHQIEETLSVKPDDEILYVHRRIHPLTEAKELENVIHSFVSCIQRWQNKINKITSKPAEMKKKPSFPPAIQVFPYKA